MQQILDATLILKERFPFTDRLDTLGSRTAFEMVSAVGERERY